MTLLSILLILAGAALGGDVKPNILWITSEDNSAHWLGCYGDEEAQTPRLDALAKVGDFNTPARMRRFVRSPDRRS